MKPKDYMIGDIMMAHLDDEEKDFPVVITGLDENGTLVDGDCEFSWRPVNKEDDDIEYSDALFPIPLTSEILEKNGFVMDSDGWYVWNDGVNNNSQVYVSIAFKRDHTTRHIEIRSTRGHANYNKMKYIHEFQHALKLLELNNLVENFKI